MKPTMKRTTKLKKPIRSKSLQTAYRKIIYAKMASDMSDGRLLINSATNLMNYVKEIAYYYALPIDSILTTLRPLLYPKLRRVHVVWLYNGEEVYREEDTNSDTTDTNI